MHKAVHGRKLTEAFIRQSQKGFEAADAQSVATIVNHAKDEKETTGRGYGRNTGRSIKYDHLEVQYPGRAQDSKERLLQHHSLANLQFLHEANAGHQAYHHGTHFATLDII